MSRARASWRDSLGLNSTTLALLGTVFLVTASTELWSPLVPQYLKVLNSRVLGGERKLLLLIGAYGFYRDALEAINYYAGGAIAGRFNTRRSLLFFNVLPFVGLGILAFWQSRLAVFLAIPFIFVWDSIAGPATLTAVGDALPAERRTMAFSLQAIFRRVARIAAYLISGAMVLLFGDARGMQAGVVLAMGFVLMAVGVQLRYMRTATRDKVVAIHQPRVMLRQFPTDLRRLLVSDIFARWAEGLAGPFIILICVPLLSQNPAIGTARYQSVLLSIQAVTSIVSYLIVGPMVSGGGRSKKPFIGLTFLFFSLFPLSLAALGPAFGFAGLGIAFVVGGLREIGEPARKAMIAELVPADVKTQAIGLYWSVRSVAVMFASPVGALLWLVGDSVKPGWGSMLLLSSAGSIGLAGAAVFFLFFGRTAKVPAA